MRRIWDWYRARRWWAKTLIAIPVLLSTITLLYVAVRGMQYWRADGDAREYLPASANFTCGVRDLSGEWERIQESDAWKSLRKRAASDRVFRGELNSMFKDSGLPTVDQLEDKRWMDGHPEYQESTILRLAGRDVAVGMRVADNFDKAKMVVATKVRFGDYLLLPFAKPLGGLFGLKKETVAGQTCLKIASGKKEYLVAIEDAYVIASDDKTLLAEGLKRKGKKLKTTRPFWLRADFASSTALAKWKKKFQGMPGGLVFAFMNVDPAKAMELEFAVQGSSFLADVRLDGAEAKPGAVDLGLASFAPANASGFELQSGGMADVYAWLRSLAAPVPKGSDFDKFMQTQARDAIKELDLGGFERDFLPRTGSPMAIILGSEVGSNDLRFTSIAFVVRSPEARGAAEALRRVLEKILKEFLNAQVESRGGGTLTYFDRKADPFGYDNYLRPCIGETADCLILGNNLEFTRRVMSAAGEDGLLQDAAYRGARQRMKDVKFDPPGGSSDLGGGILFLSAIRDGLMGHMPEIAAKTVDRSKVRPMLEAEFRKEGKDPNREPYRSEISELFQPRLTALREAAERNHEAAIQPLAYFKWFAFAGRQDGDRIALRFMLDVR